MLVKHLVLSDQTLSGTLADGGSPVTGHVVNPLIPLETRTKAIELVCIQQKKAVERLGMSVGAVNHWIKAYQ